MLEGAVMEYAKWFIGIMSAVLMAILVVFMFRINEMNAFQQEVNYQIERHGGLTPEAMVALDKHARDAYGGCLIKKVGSDGKVACAMGPDSETTSGFFVAEYVQDEATGKKTYYTRPSGNEARYGTQIRYVITRRIGNSNTSGALFEPAVIGASASRVRGTQPMPTP